MSGDSPDNPTVQKALAAVMDELPGMGKDEKSPEGYTYRSIEQIARHLQPLLAKHGVVIAPLSNFVTQHPSLAMKEGWTDTILDVEWRIYGPAGDCIEARTQGFGRDKSDKGAAKALTQARKNLLLSLFSIADKADDADGQTYEHDRLEEEPPASKEAREALRGRISELSEDDKGRAAAWIADKRMTSLMRSGATNTQLNELADYITQLTTEPWPLEGGDGDAKPSQTLGGDSNPRPPLEPHEKPFQPTVFNAETGESEPVPPNPAAKARQALSASERKSVNSALKAPDE